MSVIPCNNELWLHCVPIGIGLSVVDGDDSAFGEWYRFRCRALCGCIRVDGRIVGWKVARMNGWMERMDGWGWKNGWMNGWMGEWMGEWTDGWLDRWIDGWM